MGIQIKVEMIGTLEELRKELPQIFERTEMKAATVFTPRKESEMRTENKKEVRKPSPLASKWSNMNWSECLPEGVSAREFVAAKFQEGLNEVKIVQLMFGYARDKNPTAHPKELVRRAKGAVFNTKSELKTGRWKPKTTMDRSGRVDMTEAGLTSLEMTVK